MGLDGSWSFHPYLAAKARERGFLDGAPRPRRRRWRALRRTALAALGAIASLALLLAR